MQTGGAGEAWGQVGLEEGFGKCGGGEAGGRCS